MLRVAGAIASLALVFSACGGGGSTAPTARGTAAAAGEVTVQGFAFKPESLEVAVGSKVTWSNKDGSAHTTTSGKPGAKDNVWDGPLAPSGGTFFFTFAKAGTYTYFCMIHGSSMTGTITVK